MALLRPPLASALDLVADPSFRQGFKFEDSARKEQLLQWDKTAPPEWKAAELFSKSSLADASSVIFRANGLTFQNQYQTLIVHPENDDADLVLGINGFNEFGGSYRKPGAPWPHDYVSQRISDPKGILGQASPRLLDLKRVDLSLQVHLLYDYQHRQSGYDPHSNAAQFSLFFTIQNLNRQSKGYGDYYWFGVALYDDREAITSFHAMLDKGTPLKKGTNKMIYTVGIAPFSSGIVAKGDWVTVQGDILPYVLQGLQECWKRGYLVDSKDLSDYRFGGAMIGWEITGLNDAAAEIKNFKVTVE